MGFFGGVAAAVADRRGYKTYDEVALTLLPFYISERTAHAATGG